MDEGRPRHPVVRTGERDAIDPVTRQLIYERDGDRCTECGSIGHLQLDHVVPWSAGGSDRSDNLRSLCADHNHIRSNFVETYSPRLLGVVELCYWCARRKGLLPDRYRDAGTDGLDHINVYCGRCHATSWVPDEGWIL